MDAAKKQIKKLKDVRKRAKSVGLPITTLDKLIAGAEDEYNKLAKKRKKYLSKTSSGRYTILKEHQELVEKSAAPAFIKEQLSNVFEEAASKTEYGQSIQREQEYTKKAETLSAPSYLETALSQSPRLFHQRISDTIGDIKGAASEKFSDKATEEQLKRSGITPSTYKKYESITLPSVEDSDLPEEKISPRETSFSDFIERIQERERQATEHQVQRDIEQYKETGKLPTWFNIEVPPDIKERELETSYKRASFEQSYDIKGDALSSYEQELRTKYPEEYYEQYAPSELRFVEGGIEYLKSLPPEEQEKKIKEYMESEEFKSFITAPGSKQMITSEKLSLESDIEADTLSDIIYGKATEEEAKKELARKILFNKPEDFQKARWDQISPVARFGEMSMQSLAWETAIPGTISQFIHDKIAKQSKTIDILGTKYYNPLSPEAYGEFAKEHTTAYAPSAIEGVGMQAVPSRVGTLKPNAPTFDEFLKKEHGMTSKEIKELKEGKTEKAPTSGITIPRETLLRKQYYMKYTDIGEHQAESGSRVMQYPLESIWGAATDITLGYYTGTAASYPLKWGAQAAKGITSITVPRAYSAFKTTFLTPAKGQKYTKLQKLIHYGPDKFKDTTKMISKGGKTTGVSHVSEIIPEKTLYGKVSDIADKLKPRYRYASKTGQPYGKMYGPGSKLPYNKIDDWVDVYYSRLPKQKASAKKYTDDVLQSFDVSKDSPIVGQQPSDIKLMKFYEKHPRRTITGKYELPSYGDEIDFYQWNPEIAEIYRTGKRHKKIAEGTLPPELGGGKYSFRANTIIDRLKGQSPKIKEYAKKGYRRFTEKEVPGYQLEELTTQRKVDVDPRTMKFRDIDDLSHYKRVSRFANEYELASEQRVAGFKHYGGKRKKVWMPKEKAEDIKRILKKHTTTEKSHPRELYLDRASYEDVPEIPGTKRIEKSAENVIRFQSDKYDLARKQLTGHIDIPVEKQAFHRASIYVDRSKILKKPKEIRLSMVTRKKGRTRPMGYHIDENTIFDDAFSYAKKAKKTKTTEETLKELTPAETSDFVSQSGGAYVSKMTSGEQRQILRQLQHIDEIEEGIPKPKPRAFSFPVEQTGFELGVRTLPHISAGSIPASKVSQFQFHGTKFGQEYDRARKQRQDQLRSQIQTQEKQPRIDQTQQPIQYQPYDQQQDEIPQQRQEQDIYQDTLQKKDLQQYQYQLSNYQQRMKKAPVFTLPDEKTRRKRKRQPIPYGYSLGYRERQFKVRKLTNIKPIRKPEYTSIIK